MLIKLIFWRWVEAVRAYIHIFVSYWFGCVSSVNATRNDWQFIHDCIFHRKSFERLVQKLFEVFVRLTATVKKMKSFKNKDIGDFNQFRLLLQQFGIIQKKHFISFKAKCLTCIFEITSKVRSEFMKAFSNIEVTMLLKIQHISTSSLAQNCTKPRMMWWSMRKWELLCTIYFRTLISCTWPCFNHLIIDMGFL